MDTNNRTSKSRTILFIAAFCLLVGCSGKDPDPEPAPLPQNPVLNHTSLNLQEGGTSAEILISGGVPPYTITASGSAAQVNKLSNTTFTVTGVSAGSAVVTVRGSDSGESTLSVTISANPYKAFLADATIRLEAGGQVWTDFDHIFGIDRGRLFGSTQTKVGYSLPNGNLFEYIGWDGANYANPRFYTAAGTSPIATLQVLQVKDGKIWIAWKVASDSPENRICTKF